MIFCWIHLPLPARAGPWEGERIEEIKLDPSAPFSEEKLHQIIRIRPGDPFRARHIREAVSRLYETKKFQEIWATVENIAGVGLLLRFHWVENRILGSIELSGNRVLTDEEILKAMGLSLGDPFSEEAWKRGLENIVSRYRQEGYFQVKTASQLTPVIEERHALMASVQIREGMRARIRKVRFRGPKIFSSLTLKLRMVSQFWEYYQAGNLLDDLYALEAYYTKKGYYTATVGPSLVRYDETSNKVDIDIAIQPHHKIDLGFQGKDLFSRKRLVKRILIESERSDSEEILEESARRIEDLYHREGYPSAVATYTSQNFPEDNRKELFFVIESGSRAKIETIRFSGNHAFSKDTLLKKIDMKISGIFKKRYYVETDHERNIDTLVQFYREAGFRNASIDPEVQYDGSGNAASVIFKIDEGIRTRIDHVKITGNEIISNDELEKMLSIKTQTPYTDKKVEEDARKLIKFYTKKGYLHVSVSPAAHFSVDRTGAIITYHVNEGRQVRVGKIELDGNQRTKPHVITRNLAIQTGHPYDQDKILESQRKISQTGLFSSVRFEPPDLNKKEPLQDLRLKVVERPSIALELGVGYGDRERFRGTIEVSHRNLWGRQQEISARAEASRVEERYFLNYKKPWFFRKNLTARTSVAYLNLEEVSFDLKTFSGIIGFDVDFSKKVKGSFLYQFEQKEASDVESRASFRPEDIEEVEIGSFNTSLIRDTRDDVFNPTRGSFNSIAFRGADTFLGSEVQLLKLILQSKWYLPLPKKSVFAFSARAGAVDRFGKTESIHISERFFLGGRNTVRGYDQDELGIEGHTLVNGIPIGGNIMLVVNEELRIQLPKSFGLVLFFDHGNVWRQRRDFDPSEIKSTTGAGLRYNTPIGPFRLDWGYKLDREKDEDPSAIHFSLGHTF